MDYKKPQSTIVQGNVGIYPLTTADQVILADGSRLEKDGKINVDSAANASKLGGKAPEYYIQPRNLLDNSDFRNPVNQRGKTSYTAEGYTIDRWYGRANAQSVEVRYDDVTVTANGSAYVGIKQKIANIDRLAGETVTLAAYVYSTVGVAVGFTDADDNAISETVDSITGARVILCNYTVPSDATPDTFIPRILLRTTAQNDYMRCYWAALYEGNYTADTLPPYVPKGYGAELAECQRYFYKMKSYWKWVSAGICESSTKAYIPIVLPREMRIVPTVSITNPSLIKVKCGSIGTQIPSDIKWTYGILGARIVQMEATVTGATGGNVAFLYFDDGGEITFSADL